MKYLSLFSGIGGFELGIQQAYEDKKIRMCKTGVRTSNEVGVLRPDRDSPNDNVSDGNGWGACPICIGYSEIDKYAIQVYNKQFNHKNYGDTTKINTRELPDFDLLVGGFPCQPFSVAGKRLGFHDTRGTLFFDIARILKDKRPRYLVLENVKGLLSHDKGKTFQTILGVLSDLGYGIEWQVLNSKNFGVPQNRERVFIVGHLRGTRRPEVFPISGANEKSTREANKQGCANTLTGRNAGGQNRRGNYIKQLNNPTHSNNRVYGSDGLSPTLNTAQGGNRQPFIKGDAKIRRLTPKECERLQVFPDCWTERGIDYQISRTEYIPISDTQRYKMCGNAVTVNVIKAIMLKLL